MDRPPSSRRRVRLFVDDYRRRRSDDASAKSHRRRYLREYLRWLWPHRYAVSALLVLALAGAVLQMVEPLFMRFDSVLLKKGPQRAELFHRGNVAGFLFLALIVSSNLINAFKECWQRSVNTRVMLALRRSLLDRLLHLPLPKLWEMKTGGILSRLTGDVGTTTGLLQMAVISPTLSVVRLVIAVFVLASLNWRLALAALAIIPGIVVISLVFARRIRPIYHAVRKDAEDIDGRVGETFSGIRLIRAFRRELKERLDYMTARHTVLRKEMFAQRRETYI